MKIQIPISIGELVDKITILSIKLDRILNPDLQSHVKKEYQLLWPVMMSTFKESGIEENVYCEWYTGLKDVNKRLWDIEDDLRRMEANNIWDTACYELLHSLDPASEGGSQKVISFISTARSVYLQNDLRAKLKREINEACGSDIMEVKSYAQDNR